MAEILTTLGALVDAEPALTRLLEVRLSAKQAYDLAKLAKAVRAETAHVEEQRNALIKEYGEPVPDQPDQIKVKPEHVPEFLGRIMELRAVPTTVTVTPLTLETLPDLSGADLIALGPLVTEKE